MDKLCCKIVLYMNFAPDNRPLLHLLHIHQLTGSKFVNATYSQHAAGKVAPERDPARALQPIVQRCVCCLAFDLCNVQGLSLVDADADRFARGVGGRK